MMTTNLRTLCLQIMVMVTGLVILAGAMPNPFRTTSDDGVMVSHSGPTNALWGHENLVPDEEEQDNNIRRKRHTYSYYPASYYPAAYPSYPSSYGYGRSNPPDYYQQNWLVSEHNRYRRMVPATDMRMVYWNSQLAASAQAHANTCDFRHSRNRANIGENIWAAPYYNYSDAVGRWYAEVSNPWCGCSNGYKGCCGHYIQLVWAQTNLIGCGYAQCNGVTGAGGYHRAVFVCHYNPQGNKVMVNPNGELYAFPAFTWARTESERCSACPADQPACYQGLCYMPTGYRGKRDSSSMLLGNFDAQHTPATTNSSSPATS